MCRTRSRRALAGLVLLGAGCAPVWDHDHLDRMDRVSVRAGDAQAHNITVQSVDLIPTAGLTPLHGYDGRRIMAVMESHYGLAGGPAEQADGEANATEAAGGESGL